MADCYHQPSSSSPPPPQIKLEKETDDIADSLDFEMMCLNDTQLSTKTSSAILMDCEKPIDFILSNEDSLIFNKINHQNSNEVLTEEEEEEDEATPMDEDIDDQIPSSISSDVSAFHQNSLFDEITDEQILQHLLSFNLTQEEIDEIVRSEDVEDDCTAEYPQGFDFPQQTVQAAAAAAAVGDNSINNQTDDYDNDFDWLKNKAQAENLDSPEYDYDFYENH